MADSDIDDAEQEFNFYLPFAKRLVISLVNPNERVLASAWVTKLKDKSSGDENIRREYLKLLIFVLHRGQLVGPFTENPNEIQLDDFNPDTNILDVASRIIKKDQMSRMESGGVNAQPCSPPFSIVWSDTNNKTEYAAAQDIPHFGVHGYYAISDEPVSLWDYPPARPGKTIPMGKEEQGMKENIQYQREARKKLFKIAEEETVPPPKPVATRLVETFGMVPEKDEQSRIPWGSNLVEALDADALVNLTS